MMAQSMAILRLYHISA